MLASAGRSWRIWLQSLAFDMRDCRITVALGPVVSVRDHGDPLHARFGHDELAHGRTVGRTRWDTVENAMLFVDRHGDFRIHRMGDDPGNACRRHGRLDRHGDATARITMQIEHLVLMDQLLGCGDTFGRRAGGVFLDDLELAAMDATLIVDVLEISHQADLSFAVAGSITGKRPHNADLDGRVSQARGLLGNSRSCQ